MWEKNKCLCTFTFSTQKDKRGATKHVQNIRLNTLLSTTKKGAIFLAKRKVFNLWKKFQNNYNKQLYAEKEIIWRCNISKQKKVVCMVNYFKGSYKCNYIFKNKLLMCVTQ